MRRPFVLLVMALSFALTALGAVPAGAAATHGLMPVPVPVTGSVEYGTLMGPDYDDLWSISLGGGQQLIVTLYSAEGEDFDLCLWAPGTSDVSSKSGALIKAMHYSPTEPIKYVVPAGAGGTYYINPFCISAPEATGDYHFTVDVQSPASRVSITAPAIPGTVRTSRDYTSYGTLRPLHFVEDSSVKVEFQKYSKGRWRAAGSVTAANEDYQGYTRYRVGYSFTGWGSGKVKWRARGVHLADAMHPRQSSSWRTFWVKL